jgi:hypothetical protein
MTYYNFKTLRSLDLNFVIQTLLKGEEKDTKETYQTRKYIVAPDHKIAVTGLKWFDNTRSIGGFGAIDLVMHVMSTTLLDSAELLSNLKGNANIQNIEKINKIDSYKIPNKCERTWPRVKNYLKNIRYIPENIIDKLYNDSLVWSDENNNCVFPRDLNSGAFLRGTNQRIQYKRTIGIEGRPYVIPGGNLIIITEGPIDAISLKYYFNTATMLATGGLLGFNKIKPYLHNAKKVLLAHDNDDSGDLQAKNLLSKINGKGERLRPLNNFKDWNEVLKHEFRDKLNFKIT